MKALVAGTILNLKHGRQANEAGGQWGRRPMRQAGQQVKRCSYLTANIFAVATNRSNKFIHRYLRIVDCSRP